MPKQLFKAVPTEFSFHLVKFRWTSAEQMAITQYWNKKNVPFLNSSSYELFENNYTTYF